MKIEPAFVLPTAPSPQATPPAGPAFGDLMAIGESPDDGSRAAGFQARGMFGRHGATAATPAVEHGGRVLVAAANPSPSPATPGPGPAVVPTAPSHPSARHFPPQRQAPGADDRQPWPTRAARQSDAAAVIDETIAGPPDVAAGEQPDIGGAPGRRPATPSLPQTMRVSLGKAGEPDAAALVVRAAGLDPKEIAEFRARAQILLRERGLALDKVRINGEDHPAVEAPRGGSQAWR